MGGFSCQATIESAGAIISSILFLDSGLQKFARGAMSPCCFFYNVSSDYQLYLFERDFDTFWSRIPSSQLRYFCCRCLILSLPQLGTCHTSDWIGTDSTEIFRLRSVDYTRNLPLVLPLMDQWDFTLTSLTIFTKSSFIGGTNLDGA